jgi:pteridine reductase
MIAANARPVALITGAARRIGAAIARTLHAAGHDLALHYHRSGDDMQRLCSELEAVRADSTLSLCADLADTECLPTLVETVLARYGRLDALVNNASAYYATPLDAAAPMQWDELFAINARAAFFLSQAAMTPLRAQRGGIVNIADYYADHPPADLIPYAASKAALIAVTRGLARSLAPHVRVNAIAPGAICWPETDRTDPEKAAILACTPLARIGTRDELASTVRWLLLDAGYVTGQVINVDGGRSLG